MGTKSTELSSSATFAKWLLIFLSIVNFLIGAVIFGVGIWFILSDMNQISIVVSRHYYTITAAFICVGGILIMIVSIIGIIGAARRVKAFIMAYLICVIVVALLLVGAGLLGAIFRHQISEEVRNEMRNNLRKYYGDDKKVTNAWDTVQEDLRCCGVEEDGWSEYRDTNWYRYSSGTVGLSKPFVPQSCCRKNQYDEYINLGQCQFTEDGPPGTNSGRNNEALISQGCYTAVRNRGNIYFDYAVGIGFGVGIDIIIALICAVILLIKM